MGGWWSYVKIPADVRNSIIITSRLRVPIFKGDIRYNINYKIYSCSKSNALDTCTGTGTDTTMKQQNSVV